MTTYAPGTAIKEYQDRLAKPEEPAGPPLETYVLRNEQPDWNKVLNAGAGKGGLRVYSLAHLLAMKYWLLNPTGHKPHGGAYFTLSEQLERVQAEIDLRTQPIGQQVADEFTSLSQ